MSVTGSSYYRIERSTDATLTVTVAACVLVVTLVVLPAFSGRDFIQDLIFVFYMLALAQCWNLLAGYTGLVSVGQQAFVGLGGYLLFALTILAELDPLAAIVLVGALSAMFALPTALIVFRLRGAYFAIGTWVIAEVYRLVFAQFKQLGGGTGTSLPPSITNEVFGIEWVKLLFAVRTPAARDIISYWIALALTVATILLVYLILRSRRGLALGAIRDSEVAAESIGVDSFRIKLGIYVITAAATGMTGGLIYLQKARISPDAAFSVLDWTAYVIFIVVIGGIGTIEGPILGTIVFYLMQRYLASFGAWYLILLGGLAISVMLFAPKGLWGYVSERYRLVIFPIRRRLVVEERDRRRAISQTEIEMAPSYAFVLTAFRQAMATYLPELHRCGSTAFRFFVVVSRQAVTICLSAMLRRRAAINRFLTPFHRQAMTTYLPELLRRGSVVYSFLSDVFWQAITTSLSILRRSALSIEKMVSAVRGLVMTLYLSAIRLAMRGRSPAVSSDSANWKLPMSKQVQGKICVITGGAGSIGQATAKLMLAEGAKVMLLDLNEAALKKVAADIDVDSLAWAVVDITKSDQVKNCISRTVSRWGKIDVLFSNAGNLGVVAPTTEYSEDVFDAVLAVHVKGAFLAAKHTLPYMNNGGSIIFASSIAGVEGTPGVCAYITARHAQVGLMRVLAKEVAVRNIRVNTIHHGPIDNESQFHAEKDLRLERDATAFFNEIIPQRRHVRPEEVARSVLYLASDASSFTTGSLLMLDGGLSG